MLQTKVVEKIKLSFCVQQIFAF